MPPQAASRRSFLAGAMAGSVGGVLAMTTVHPTGHAAAAHPADLGPGLVDIGFCTDMAAHHIQAVDMCERVLGRDTGGAVQSAATEVLRNQSIEIGMMRAWLADWGASTVPPTTVMAWMASNHVDPNHDEMNEMEHGVPLSSMPGYASAEELSALSLAAGRDKGRMWLQLMRAHHVGGAAMAEVAAATATQEKVIRLARTQAKVQSFEISQYDLLLASEYPGPSWPEPS